MPVLIVFIAGMTLLAEYFFTLPQPKAAAIELRTWAIIIFEFAILFGTISLFRLHLSNVIRRRSRGQTFHSAWLLMVFLIFFVLGVSLPGRIGNRDYVMMYNSIYMSGTMAVWSLNTFWVAIGAYRSWRLRNARAAVLMIAGFLVVLGYAPWAEVAWAGFPSVGQWMQDVPFKAGMTAITLVLGLGAIYYSIRTLLGQETSYMGK